MQLQQQGRFDEARMAWKTILARDPRNVPALANLASVQARTGRESQARKLYRRALKIEPRSPELWFNYGNLLANSGQRAEAETAFRTALKINDRLAPAWYNLGALLRDTDRLGEARQCFEKAVERAPTFSRAHCALGELATDSGEAAAALEHYKTAREQNPADPVPYAGMGHLLAENGQLEDAIQAFRGALGLRPDSAEYLTALANLYSLTGQEQHAIASWQELASRHPDSSEAHLNLGRLAFRYQQSPEDVERAISLLRQAVRLDPGSLDAGAQLGFTLAESGRIGEARDIAQSLVRKHPDQVLAWTLSGFVAVQQGRINDGLEAYREARRVDPGDGTAAINLCFSSLYADSIDSEALTELHREVGNDIAERVAEQPMQPPASIQGRRLRVGYLSPDLRSHPVGYFMAPILEHHDRDQFEVFGYANVVALDDTGRSLAEHCSTMRVVSNLDDAGLAELIRSDKLDLLVDLAGLTANSRVGVIAQRVAPVQALYLGYPCTSGLPAMDYCIGDHLLMPERAGRLYSERLARLDHPFLCFRPQPGTPDVAALPAQTNGFVTFGSFNNYSKVSDRCLALWAQVLDARPDSKLIVQAQVLSDPEQVSLARQRFEDAGIAGDRVQLRGPVSPVTKFLECYADVDIALDTLPYCGGTTSCDALWMGVPVVSLAGEHFHQRMGASILSAAGHPEWAADDEASFLAVAQDLADDIDGLAEIRRELRVELAASALCDGPGMAAALENAYRTMIGAET